MRRQTESNQEDKKVTLLRSLLGDGTPGPHGGVTIERVYATITSGCGAPGEQGETDGVEMEREKRKNKIIIIIIIK